MKSLENTIVSKSDSARLPIVPGTYPAHVSEFASMEYNDSIVFNLTYVIATEASQLEINKMFLDDGQLVKTTDAEGADVMISASYMSGKPFKGGGVWLTPSPGQGEGWKNKKYQQHCENMGIVFDTNDDGETILGEIEENDVVGKPVLIKLGQEEYTKDGQTKTAWKVFTVYPWKEGSIMSAEEMKSDVPF